MSARLPATFRDRSSVEGGRDLHPPTPFFEERGIPPPTPSNLDYSLRLLARLLVKAATAAETAPPADDHNQVDVAAPPKVGSDRR